VRLNLCKNEDRRAGSTLTTEQRTHDWTDDQKRIIETCASGTHEIWTEKVAGEVTEIFGFECLTRLFYDDPDEPKGVHLNDPSQPIRGIDSEGILGQIAKHVGHRWSDRTLDYMGRGFRVRAKAEELLKTTG